MQQRLVPLKPHKYVGPQVDYVRDGIHYIELNRGCLRGCEFCHASKKYEEFSIPTMKSNKVQVIGEGFLYDSRGGDLIKEMGEQKFNDRVVRFGLSQGLDYRLLNEKLVRLCSKSRFGIINSHGTWYKGVRLAWDFGLKQRHGLKRVIDMFVKNKYQPNHIIIFMLTNWKTDYFTYQNKLFYLRQWGVKVDDTTYETTKRERLPFHWTPEELKANRMTCRIHNIGVVRGAIKPNGDQYG